MRVCNGKLKARPHTDEWKGCERQTQICICNEHQQRRTFGHYLPRTVNFLNCYVSSERILCPETTTFTHTRHTQTVDLPWTMAAAVSVTAVNCCDCSHFQPDLLLRQNFTHFSVNSFVSLNVLSWNLALHADTGDGRLSDFIWKTHCPTHFGWMTFELMR